MKQVSAVLLAVVLFTSCQNTAVAKVVPIIDSPQLVYKDSTQGPFLLNGVRHIFTTFRPLNNDSTQTKGVWVSDSSYWAKIQTDTLKAPNATHTYRYQPLDKRFVQVVSIPVSTPKK